MSTKPVPAEDTMAATQHPYVTSLAQVEAVLAALTVGTDNSKMPIQQVRLFLHVAAHGEVFQTGLAGAVGIAQSSVSSNVAILGKGLRPGEEGYGLLESGEVPHYRRCKSVWLTERGKALAWDMQRALTATPLKAQHHS